MMKNTSPLKSRTQVLHVKKTFPEASNVATYYTLKKASKFVPYPYEHLIQGGRHRRPATQTTPKQRNPQKGYFWLNMQFVTHNYYRPDTHCFKTKNLNL